MKEIWKEIEGFSRYEISNLGQVRSCCTRQSTQSRSNTFKILKQSKDKDGYVTVTLYPDDKNSRAKRILVHRLVAKYFVNNPNNYNVVNHIDEDKKNNVASNLMWCTTAENLKYSNIHQRGLATKQRIKACNAEKPIIATKDGQIVLEFKSVAEAARDERFSRWGLQLALNGQRKTYKGYKWYYKENKHEFRS